jgi:alpha-L-fucosidase
MPHLTRREFVATAIGAGALVGASSHAGAATVPSYLRGYESPYRENPRTAAVEWFRNAKFGLFIHYGLFSLLERHEWVQLREKIRPAEYAKLKDRFTAEKFDADFITDLALAAQMRYITLVTKHHDGFCLFRTSQTDFNSLNSPSKRDLAGELAEACRKKGLGLFFYYSHGRDWKHPHAPNNDEWGGQARPQYDPPETSYAYGKEHDLQKYVAFVTAQIKELLTQYGPVAGIWLDGIMVPKTGPVEQFHCQELYDMIHRMQPQVLVSYKQGLLGTEDFMAPEMKAIDNPTGKPMEICASLQRNGWGYVKGATHNTADEVMQKLAAAAKAKANLLLNTGPLPDGSIYPGDVTVLREVGARIKAGRA